MASILTLDQKVAPDRRIRRTALCKLFTFEQIRIVCSQKRNNNIAQGQTRLEVNQCNGDVTSRIRPSPLSHCD
jgi:hypothetical protein